MAQGTVTIDKIKLIDGTIVNLLTNQNISIPDLAEVNLYPQYSTLDGTVTLISGSTTDYRLTLAGTP